MWPAVYSLIVCLALAEVALSGDDVCQEGYTYFEEGNLCVQVVTDEPEMLLSRTQKDFQAGIDSMALTDVTSHVKLYRNPAQAYKCPGKLWRMHGKTCFRGFHDVSLNWTAAREFCKCQGGDLVQMFDNEKNQFISHRMLTGERYWIGTYYDVEGGNFKHLNGEDVMDSLLPTPHESQNCVELVTWSKAPWVSGPCEVEAKVICEKDATVSVEDSIPDYAPPEVNDKDYTCDEGTVGPYQGFCMEVHNEAKNWTDARQDCETRGGDLVSIYDVKKKGFIIAHLLFQRLLKPGGRYWIGAQDLDNDGEYAYPDGRPLNSYRPWNSEVPDFHNAWPGCGELIAWSAGHWDDVGCDKLVPYLCERPANGVVDTTT